VKLGRYDKYLGHMPYRLPILFVCAECGGGISVCCTDDGGYNVICMADERHEGLRSSEEVQQIEAKRQTTLSIDQVAQLDSIARQLPEVKRYMEEQRQTLKKELFGED